MNCGIIELLDFMKKFLPVYKSQEKTDDFAGKVFSLRYQDSKWNSYVKILNGSLSNRSLINYEDKMVKINNIITQNGSNPISIDNANTGQLIIIPNTLFKLGSIIGKNNNSFQTINYVNPLFNITLTSNDTQKLAEGLNILYTEDPHLNLRYNKITKKFSIDTIGELQGEIILRLLHDRFNINATIKNSSITFKETPISVGYGKSGYKRCSNVGIQITPLPLGSGLKFVSKFSTDFLFVKYQKQIEKLIMQKYSKFALNGWELTDAEIAIIDGKCDNAGSESTHYSIAAPIAFFRALNNAKTKLLEPLMNFSISFESQLLNTVIQECSKCSQANFNIDYKNNNMSLISGQAPLSFTKNLPIILNKKLSGTFSFIQEEIGYIDYINEKQSKRIIPYTSPLEEHAFIIEQGGSIMLLDKDLNKIKGKPEKERRNHFLSKPKLKSNGKPININKKA